MSGFYAELLGANGAYKFLLGNEWRESGSGKRLPIICPSTNGPCYEVQGAFRNGAAPLANSLILACGPAWALASPGSGTRVTIVHLWH